MKKLSKYLLSIAIISFLFLPVLSINVQADDDPFGMTPVTTGLGNNLGEEGSDPRELIARVINVALGFLGVIAVVIILFGGLKWMTAAGNEDKVEEARKILVSGIIGLVIVLAAWGLASWVINTIRDNVIS